MAKPKDLDRKIRAVRALKRAGATVEQIEELERAVLHEVSEQAGIGGNAHDYVISRIKELGET